LQAGSTCSLPGADQAMLLLSMLTAQQCRLPNAGWCSTND
jgi:hypothetical protein